MDTQVSSLQQQCRRLLQTGCFAQAREAYARLIELSPDDASAHLELGLVLLKLGQYDRMTGPLTRAMQINPRLAPAARLLGTAYARLGRLPEAIMAFRKAVDIQPENSDTRFQLATALHQSGQHREAAELFERVVAKHPDYPDAYTGLGLARARLGEYSAAIDAYRQAIEQQPDSARAWNNLGNALRMQNDLTGAIDAYRKALQIQPDHATAGSNLLLALNYLPGLTQESLYEEARQFEQRHLQNIDTTDIAFQNPRTTDRKLRVGYLSPDFRAHSVAHFTRKLFAAHHRDAVEVFCYSNVLQEDPVTEEFRAGADHWIRVRRLSDEKLADRIRQDRIDILVDLAGHTADNRLLTFARRAAPVQVNWLGYPNTTGLGAMDYRITDAVADPPGETDRLHSETLLRLPTGFLCYQPGEPWPDVAAPPSARNGYISFGSFNALPKMTPAVIELWARLLQTVPDSRLVLKSAALADDTTRRRYLDAFSEHGISAQRLELLGLVPGRLAHLELYSKVDIALDTFPYNGTTTTCEALWMGVPVIAL
ncbi:MAG TPA: tetratricopeptide repeat protein, partial [Chromatiales bacterium]|nr:tetratricopeptide repeat protein [Chromatiales bacterium]